MLTVNHVRCLLTVLQIQLSLVLREIERPSEGVCSAMEGADGYSGNWSARPEDHMWPELYQNGGGSDWF